MPARSSPPWSWSNTASDKRFVVVDAAMNDLIRPTLYEAHHEILPVLAPAGADLSLADVVGAGLRDGGLSGARARATAVAAGDLLAVMSAGAYGAVQAGTYNTRLLVPEVMVSGETFAVIRPRGDYDALIGLDRVPAWLADRRRSHNADSASSYGRGLIRFGSFARWFPGFAG